MIETSSGCQRWCIFRRRLLIVNWYSTVHVCFNPSCSWLFSFVSPPLLPSLRYKQLYWSRAPNFPARAVRAPKLSSCAISPPVCSASSLHSCWQTEEPGANTKERERELEAGPHIDTAMETAVGPNLCGQSPRAASLSHRALPPGVTCPRCAVNLSTLASLITAGKDSWGLGVAGEGNSLADPSPLPTRATPSPRTLLGRPQWTGPGDRPNSGWNRRRGSMKWKSEGRRSRPLCLGARKYFHLTGVCFFIKY